MKKLLLLITFLTFIVISNAQLVGDFQTGGSGSWSNSNTWLEYEFSGIWNNTANIPTGASTVTIRNGHTVTRTSVLDVSGNLTIAPGGDLDMTGYSLTVSGGTVLIQSDATGTGELICNGTPTISIQRYIDSPNNSTWHQIGVPVGGATANTIYQNNSPNVWLQKWNSYEVPAQTWQFITDQNAALNQLVGYMVTGDASFTINWNGAIKTDNVFQTLPANFLPANAYLIFGNPYASSIEVFAAGDSLGPNFVNSIWVWDPSSSQYTSYQMGTGGTNPGIVAAGQSMFVQIIDNTAGSSFSLSAANRVLSATDNFLKKSGTIDWSDDYGKGVYAMFKVVDGNSEDAGFVNFGVNGTVGFENGYDGIKKFGSNEVPQMYFVQGDLQLSTDYLKSLNEEEEYTVKLNLKPAKDGEHILAANLNSLPNTKVILEDLKTGIFQNFNQYEQYVFNATPQDDAERFLLHFISSPTGLDEQMDPNSDYISIYSYGNNIYLSNNKTSQSVSDVLIFDLMGREIYSNKIAINGTVRIPINVAENYLIVKVISENNVTTKKIYVK